MEKDYQVRLPDRVALQFYDSFAMTKFRELQQQTTATHQVKGAAIIKPPSTARRLAPRGIATGLCGPRWRL